MTKKRGIRFNSDPSLPSYCMNNLFCGGSFCCRSLSSRSLGCGSCLFGVALAAAAGAAGFLCRVVLEHCLIVVNEFNEASLSVVTKTVAGFEDTGVSTVAVSDLL